MDQTQDLLFDQYQRYALAAAVVEALRGGKRRLRVLEVGANQHRNLEKFLPQDHIAYLDQEGPGAGQSIPRFVLGDATRMPFPSRSFDVVLSLDVFEHVPADHRARFIEESARVARAGVLLAAPFQTDELEAAEKEADAYFAGMFGTPFRWLDEHRQQGLPSLEDTVRLVRQVGLHVFSFGHGNLRLWSSIMRLHFLKEGVHALGPAVRTLDGLYNRLVAGRDYAPPFYRHFLVGLPSVSAAAELAKGFSQGSADPDLPAFVEGLVAPALIAGKALFDTEKTLAAATTELAKAQGALEEGRTREAQAAHDLESARVRAYELARELTQTATRAFASSAEAERLRAEVERLETEGAATRRRTEEQATSLRALEGVWQSTSWRVTAPLRSLTRMARRMAAKVKTAPALLHRLSSSSRRARRAARQLEKSGHFDSAFYLRSYPDVAAARIRPALHYDLSGWVEGRDPSASFSTTYYLSSYPDVAASGMNPLLHYLRYGSPEGRLARPPGPPAVPGYQDWIERFDTLGATDLSLIRDRIQHLPPTLISVLMPVYNPPEKFLRRALDSVRTQIYENWELCIADDCSTLPHVKQVLNQYRLLDPRIKVTFRPRNGHISEASNSALDLASGPYLALLDHDDELPPHALYMVAEALARHPEADVCYSDEDKIDDEGRRFDPYFKCDWNEGLFHAQNLISHLGVFRTALVREVGGFRVSYEGSQDYDLALRCLERSRPERIVHIPFVLYHWRAIPGSTAVAADEKAYALAAAVRALNDSLGRVGVAAEVVDSFPFPRTRFALPNPRPSVSLIVPTRDGYEILRACVESVLTRTTYGNYEIVIVDNESSDPRVLGYLIQLAARPRVRVIRYSAPFNFSALNNFAVGQSRGEVLCLLNNDVEVITPGWLEEMVSHAIRPEIGAVGAKLLYPDDTVQHAGVILGLLGVAGHAFKHRPASDHGYFGRASVGHELSAVTAACLAVRRAVYDEVGGLDEENLKVAFNDVDFCLRLRQRGYRNYWTPHALLYHHESKTRGYEDNPEKQARFQREVAYMLETWSPLLQNDPAYSPNLSLGATDFSLAFPPRVSPPWVVGGGGSADPAPRR